MKTRISFTVLLCLLISISYAQENLNNCNNQTLASDEIPVIKTNTGDVEIDNLIYKRKLIKYFRTAYDMPEFIDTGNLESDIRAFNTDIKIWYQQYPDFVDILDLREYEQFRKFDVSCYTNPPKYTKGCSQAEEKAYRKRFNNWLAHHPDAPKLMGDDEKSKQLHELEKAEFYNKYFKK